MYNLRYHIASLVAVFLALSVGLLLGTIVVDRGVIEAQRTTLVESIGRSVDKVTAANQQLRDANASLNAFAAQSAPRRAARRARGTHRRSCIADPDAGRHRGARDGGAARSPARRRPSPRSPDRDSSLGDAKVAGRRDEGARLASRVRAGDARDRRTLAREWTTPGDGRGLTAALIGAGGLELEGLTATDDGRWDRPDRDVRRQAGRLRPRARAKALTGPGRFGVGVETAKRRDRAGEARVHAGALGRRRRRLAARAGLARVGARGPGSRLFGMRQGSGRARSPTRCSRSERRAGRYEAVGAARRRGAAERRATCANWRPRCAKPAASRPVASCVIVVGTSTTRRPRAQGADGERDLDAVAERERRHRSRHARVIARWPERGALGGERAAGASAERADPEAGEALDEPEARLAGWRRERGHRHVGLARGDRARAAAAPCRGARRRGRRRAGAARRRRRAPPPGRRRARRPCRRCARSRRTCAPAASASAAVSSRTRRR